MSRRGHHAWCLTGFLLALCGPPTHSFEVKVEGTSSEVGYGGTVLLNCSSTCPDENALGGLETSLSKELVAQGPRWFSTRLYNITESHSEVFCYFSCFGERKMVAFRVLAYEFPQPQVSISHPNTSYNQTVTIECSSEPSWPPGLKLRLHGSPLDPPTWKEGPVREELTVKEEHDGAEFFCEGQLSLGNQTLQKSSPVATLRVTYQPRMDNESCPPSQNWTEGQEETLSCWAWGNPLPHMECAKNGETFPVGVPHPVTHTHAGTYHCRATNPLGTAIQTVTVRVQYQPQMDDRSCPPSQIWTEGQEETLSCWAWGNPLPHMECAKNGEFFPIGVPHTVTHTHAGTYHCRATNPLGTAVQTVTVRVQYHAPNLLPLLLVGLVVVALLVAGAAAYHVYYRKKKIREYRLREEQRRLQMVPPGPEQEEDPPNEEGAPP